MIFAGQAAWVPSMARAVLLALGEHVADHLWPEHEWSVFETVCQEELASDAIEVRAARAGVVCHSNRLTPQVRLALEHLMRSKPPKIIIATTTLAQGVNVGISSVIVATPYIGLTTIDKRDFWNICGRAGRAFVDGEGKILYAIDDTRAQWQIRNDENLAKSYFDAGSSDRVESGLLHIVSQLRKIALQGGVSFDLLLELAANNDFSCLKDEAYDVENICDLVDDELLSLHEDPAVNSSGEESTDWIEQVFRGSLAAIQSRWAAPEIETDDVLAFLRARADSALRRVARPARKAIVSSGLPLMVALRAHETLDIFETVADAYSAEEKTLQALVAAVRALEEWARMHAASLTGAMPEAVKLDAVRAGWLGGVGLQMLSVGDTDARAISKDLYGYQLPWIIHAASQQLRSSDRTNQADVLAKIALLVELGVPTELAARIFLAGVRSRAAASELAALDVVFGTSISEISRTLRNPELNEQLRPQVSSATAVWLDLLIGEAARGRRETAPEFPAFTVRGTDTVDVLHARILANQVSLCTVDGQTRVLVEATAELPFDRVANNPRVSFVRSGSVWRLAVRDPRLEQYDY